MNQLRAVLVVLAAIELQACGLWIKGPEGTLGEHEAIFQGTQCADWPAARVTVVWPGEAYQGLGAQGPINSGYECAVYPLKLGLSKATAQAVGYVLYVPAAKEFQDSCVSAFCAKTSELNPTSDAP